MGRKFDKIDKIRGKDRKESIDEALDDVPKLRGCPVPEPIQCSGKRSEATLDDGILMECTNVSCPFKEVPVHDSCFKTYEDHLVRTMGAMGSARGWTEAQRRSNLWEKKGQSLVAKVGRCRCGHGTTRRNEDAFYAREKKRQQEALLALGVTAKKKVLKPKTKELPTLNFAPVKTAPLTANSEDRPFRPIVRRVTLSYRKRAPSSSSTASHEDLIYCSRNDPFGEQGVIPAPRPPRQTMSYASAARRDSSDQECEGLRDIYEDSGIEMKNGDSSATSECSDLSKDRSSLVSPYDRSTSEYSDDVKVDILPMETPKSSRSMWQEDTSLVSANQLRPKDIQLEKKHIPVLSILENQEASGSFFYTPPISVPGSDSAKGNRFSFTIWSPMFGFGFNIGESLLATTYLPVRYQ